MDPRHEEEDEQFLMDMIASGSGAAGHMEETYAEQADDGNEQADDASNTDVYLNMSGEGMEQSGDDVADQEAAEQEANVYFITAFDPSI